MGSRSSSPLGLDRKSQGCRRHPPQHHGQPGDDPAAFGNDEASVGVSWLPLHHDMGLIGCIIQPLYLGARTVLMSPLAFLQSPMRWLRAIAEHGATNSGSPNFGYELCLRQISDAQCRGLDLSRWRLAFCGSEPVRPRTMERFAARFAPFGFDPASLYACYGLAEATLLVTGGRAGSGIAHRRVNGIVQATVSCGRPAPGCEVSRARQARRRPSPPPAKPARSACAASMSSPGSLVRARRRDRGRSRAPAHDRGVPLPAHRRSRQPRSRASFTWSAGSRIC